MAVMTNQEVGFGTTFRAGCARAACCWRGLGMIAAVGVWLVCSSRGFAADAAPAKPSDRIADPEPMTLVTNDGVTVHITYYKSNVGKEAPVVILLHEKGGNRFVWQSKNGLAEQLQADGFAVITVDLRGHGESKGGAAATSPTGNVNQPADKKKKTGDKKEKSETGKARGGASNDLKPWDYENMCAIDMEAVKKFIYQENQAQNLNMNKIGIAGPEMGASVAAYFALADWEKEPHSDCIGPARTPRGQDVRALVFISPQEKFHNLPIAKPIAELRDPEFGVAFFVCAGKGDKGQAKKVFATLSSFPESDKRMYFREYGAQVQGTQLLGKNLKLEPEMLAFFHKHLKDLPSTWRDRQSKLDKPKKP